MSNCDLEVELYVSKVFYVMSLKNICNAFIIEKVLYVALSLVFLFFLPGYSCMLYDLHESHLKINKGI